MTGALIAIRPEPGLSATLAAARAMGLPIWGEPLFAIRPVAWDVPDPAGFDGLLIGSANAIRHFGPARADWTGKPVYAVGDATAQAARDAGFSVAVTGEGYLQGVVDRLAGEEQAFLRVTGAEHVPVQPPAGISIATRVAYENVSLPVSDALAACLSRGATVLLHSAVAARHLASECDRLDLPRERIALAALGPRIAEAAGQGWAARHVAQRPREADLLALARDMCH